MRAGLSPRAEEFLDVLPEQIGFDIDGVADLPSAQGRPRQRKRNNPDAEALLADAGHGQADAVDRNRALSNDIAQHRSWRRDVEHMVQTDFFPANNAAKLVDMASNEVAAQRTIAPQR